MFSLRATRRREGFERRTRKDFAHFLDLAKGSCGEVRSLLHAAQDLGFVKSDHAEQLRCTAEVLSRRIAAFATRLRS